MIKLLATFIILLICIPLSLTTEEVASKDQNDDWGLKPEYHPFSLTCLIFKDTGCDVDCFTMTNAFGLLGGGICDKNNVCVCSFAIDASLNGLWKEKFEFSADLITQIESDDELHKKVFTLLAVPFRTGYEIRRELRDNLPDDKKDELRVIDACPAAKMTETPAKIRNNRVKKYVNTILSKELESSSKELSSIDLYAALVKALDDYRPDLAKFKLLVSMIRQTENNSMNEILSHYLIINGISESENPNPEEGSNEKKTSNEDTNTNNRKTDSIADSISREIINKLVKKTENTIMGNLWNWIGETCTYLISACVSSTNQQINEMDMTEIPDNPDFFRLPSKVKKKISNKDDSINKTLKENGFTLRYRRNKNKDSININLNWIKKPVVVNIMKISESNVNQNWVFGAVTINMTRRSDGYRNQNWDFGAKTYQYYKTIGPNGGTNEKWSDGIAEVNSLEKYKSLIQTWCYYNEYLIGKDDCVIFESIQNDEIHKPEIENTHSTSP